MHKEVLRFATHHSSVVRTRRDTVQHSPYSLGIYDGAEKMRIPSYTPEV